jgi:putative tricarboxylic transport membrane protein
MTKQERVAGWVFILFGLFVAIYSTSALKIGTVSQPGPGLFPLICGVGIVVLCILWQFKNRQNCLDSDPLWEDGNWKGPLLAVVIMFAYAALMETLGYTLSTLIFLVSWQMLIEQEKWRKTAVIAIIGTASMYVIFVYLLGVALPDGIFGI